MAPAAHARGAGTPLSDCAFYYAVAARPAHTRQLRLLVATQYFWPESFRINDVARGLRERGHELEVLTAMPNYPGGSLYPGYGWFSPSRELYGDIPVTRAPLITRGADKNVRLAANYLSFALSATLTGLLRLKGRFDAVLAFQPSPVLIGVPALVLGRVKRAPVLLWIQDLWPESLEAVGVGGGIVARAARATSDAIHRRCDLLLAQSKGYEEKLVARGVPRSRIEYLPNWAEDMFRPLDRNASVADPLAAFEGFRILFAGNIGSAQSFETVVEAATRLREAKHIQWIVVGEGNMRPWLEAEIVRRGLSTTVHVLGWQPVETMPAFFAHADALLVTLRSDPVFELTVPSKIQACLASAKPVLAALNGEGAAILRESKAAVVGPAGDPEALADGALRLSRMTPHERLEMGLSGRAYFQANFDRSLLLDRLEALLQRAIDERAHTRARR